MHFQNFLKRGMHQSIWHESYLSPEVIKILAEDVKKFDCNTEASRVKIGGRYALNTKIRHSRNAWIPASNWIYELIWACVISANRVNFGYDLIGFDDNKIQYTQYGVGAYYKWHCDELDNSDSERLRKLTIVVQLSGQDDYQGGNLEVIGLGGVRYIAPRAKGSIVVFDSRAVHRVTKIKYGYRRTIVAWAIGPRCK
jgi:PKHD-type hydroxylase